MLPLFPKFKKLTLADKTDIEIITKKYPPYSDFNFTSLWSYNTEDDIIISNINNNLAIRFRDYITNEPFYSFLGDNQVVNTTENLLKLSVKEKLPPVLKLVPELATTIDKKLHDKFLVIEDRDNFDYVLSSHELSQLKGNKYKSKRKHLKIFHKDFPNHNIIVLNLKDTLHQLHIIDAFFDWEKSKGKKRKETEHELIAVRRLLEHHHYFNLLSIGLYHQNKIVGFSIAEIVHQQYAINHFMKFNYSYKGASEALDKALSEYLITKKCHYLNIEQDMGVPGLKESKQLCRPVHFLKKYKISPKK